MTIFQVSIQVIGWLTLAGDGRCNRLAANFSPGDSKVTTGAPNVAPRRLARAPPRECPIIQMVESGLRKDVSQIRFSVSRMHSAKGHAQLDVSKIIV
jgi:hypothetical protein